MDSDFWHLRMGRHISGFHLPNALSANRELCTIQQIMAFSEHIIRRYVYCTISTNSSVTGHSDPQREDLGDLSQVTTVIEEMDKKFRCLRRTNYWFPENLLKRCPGCHTSSQVPKRCSSLCGGHGSQGGKSRSKWYSILLIGWLKRQFLWFKSTG